MDRRNLKLHARLLCGAAVVVMLAGAAQAEETTRFDIPPQSLATALAAFGVQSRHPVIATPDLTDAKTTRGLNDSAEADAALRRMLNGTGLTYRRTGDAYLIVRVSDARGDQRPIRTLAVAAEADAAPTASAVPEGNVVQELIVTAQKREEAIQTVPIAISAFTQKTLEAQKIETGGDLMKAIPNVTFSKNNFSGYNFSIRGIGTKAVSVTTDPGVAVSFNSTTLIRNRLFEQEYFDVERVEVLRGPQGTLYGRNATSGVINVISAKPDLSAFSGMVKAEVGNYQTRRAVGMINIPVMGDKLAVRIAGSATMRDGYGFNLFTNKPTDGRNLWSARLTVGFKPIDRLHGNFVWEHFNEDDDRARTGKQLCTRDPGPDSVAGFSLDDIIHQGGSRDAAVRGRFSQGCLPGSLYDDKAFATPNGLAIPFLLYLADQDYGYCSGCNDYTPNHHVDVMNNPDPYGSQMQSRNLRDLYSQILPVYRAKADVFELNFDFDVTPSLTLSSQTAYDRDQIYSTQDYNRYTTLPVFGDSSNAFNAAGNDPATEPSAFNLARISPNGVFCDPQVGCSDTIVGQDLSRAKSSQFSQELRLQTNFSGRVNFNVGLNYTRYRTVEDYYVFFNGITLTSIMTNTFFSPVGSRAPDRFTTHPDCDAVGGPFGADVPDSFLCSPIEQNPISNIQDTGHNYFLSRNPYRLQSKAVFGEIYWQVSDTIKITAGARYTDDKKVVTPIPSETLLTQASRFDAFEPVVGADGVVFAKALTLLSSFGSGAYPALPDVSRQWREVTGRFGVDWKPALGFTDQTLLYAFYSRGYKGGGMNPPPIGLDYVTTASLGQIFAPTAPPEFRPEFVDAFEVGGKNTLLGGSLILNGDVFFYNYTDYQVSKIVDRSAQNENFDAKVWGVELESVWQPTRDLRFNMALGYLDTELAKGSKSIDIMNRTAGHADWVVLKPLVQLSSNCIAPAWAARESIEGSGFPTSSLSGLCPGADITRMVTSYRPYEHPEANYGAGFDTDVSGNELPNSPHYTISLGGQYSIDFLEGWRATLRGDFYWQSQQWARVYELPIDKLHAWKNANVRLTFEKPDSGLEIELYVKNVFNDTPITDTFTNSDDSALTTNIFVLDPRIIGLSVKKTF